MTIQDIARLKAIKKGNIQEYELLFREYFQPLLSYAVSIIKSEANAEEIVQDIFFGIWKNKKSLDIHTSFSSYLYKAVYNNCLQLLKREKRKLNYQQDGRNWNNHESMNPGEILLYNELSVKINKVVEELPENCKTIFKLNRYQGLKYSEIADKLAISIKTVEANMTKALKYLKRQMDEYVHIN
ncbi:MAG: RNA polymerase sigma-70 factor [Bacteroidales bacterium]|nr:RNA polymerase sigma-70 factor [Bacteroidales bacterium]